MNSPKTVLEPNYGVSEYGAMSLELWKSTEGLPRDLRRYIMRRYIDVLLDNSLMLVVKKEESSD